MSRDPAVTFGCTDDGQHGWISLGDMSVVAGTFRVNRSFGYGETGQKRKVECVWLEDVGRALPRVNVRCNRCGRHLQWGGDRALQILESLRDSRVSQVDISKIA